MKKVCFSCLVCLLLLLFLAGGTTIVAFAQSSKEEATSFSSSSSMVRQLRFSEISDLAVINHPALQQAGYRLEAIRGEWVQAGLRANPEIGYLGEEMNREHAGRQGITLSQPIIPQRKLTARQAAIDREYQTALQDWQTQNHKVQNDAMIAAYRVALAYQKYQIVQGLQQIAQESLKVGTSLFKAKEISLSDHLDMKVQTRRTEMTLHDAQIEHQMMQHELVILLRLPSDTSIQILDEIVALPPELSREQLWEEIRRSSPELLAARANVEVAQAALRRECVETGLDYNTEAAVAYNTETKNTEFTIGVAIPLKLFDRNQGNIHRAKAQVAQANSNVQRVDMLLHTRYSQLFGAYELARHRVVAYEQDILSQARESLELALTAWRQGEYGSLDMLTSQRTLFSVQLEHLDNLQRLWESYVLLTGSLLSGGLETDI